VSLSILRYWNLEGEALDRTVSRTRFGSLYRSVVRQNELNVYTVKIRNLAHFKYIIREAGEQVLRDMIQGVWQEVEYRLDIS
jgi:hypothetical protein